MSLTLLDFNHLTLVLFLSFFSLQIVPQRPSHSATRVHTQLLRGNRNKHSSVRQLEDGFTLSATRYPLSIKTLHYRAPCRAVKFPVWIITSSLASLSRSRFPSLRLIFCMSSIFWRTASAVLRDKQRKNGTFISYLIPHQPAVYGTVFVKYY